MNKNRIVVAFLAAPATPALLAGLFTLNIGVLAVWAALTYPFALALGIPAYFLFSKLGWFRPGQVVLGAVVLGFLAFLAANAFLGSDLSAEVALFFIASSTLVSLVFCLIAFGGTRSADGQSSN